MIDVSEYTPEEREILRANGQWLMRQVMGNAQSRREYYEGMVAGQLDRIREGGRLSESEKREGQKAFIAMQKK